MTDGHGDDLYRYGSRVKFNFSSNIAQGVDHAALKAHLVSCLDVIANYPEVEPYSVEGLLAVKLGMPAGCIMATNGAADGIHLIARAFRGSISAVIQPSFAEYADACRVSEHQLRGVSDICALPPEADMVWICNPNNPTGEAFDYEKLVELISLNTDKIFVVDQAYHRYTSCRCLEPAQVLKLPNLILIYSLTKDYAMPGLRLGYIVANPDLIAKFKGYRVPWSVNALAIEAGKFLLGRGDMCFDIDGLLREAHRVADAFAEMNISVMPSDTNFMLCRLPAGRASDLKEYLVRAHGILIRDASNFEGLSEAHFRVAVQNAATNDLLINALRLWMLS